MNDDVAQDLKQFISATITQQTAGLRGHIKRLEAKLDSVDKKIDNISLSIAEALDYTNEIVDSQHKDHDMRITKLEQKVFAKS